jgi:hypothetical protein
MTENPPAAAADGPLAVYANYCEVGHNALEFLIDFGQFRPETDAVCIHSRIVTGPLVAKLAARLLSDAVARFEASHGLIAELTDDNALDALIGSIPDFERRAISARSRPVRPPNPAASFVPPGADAPKSSR